MTRGNIGLALLLFGVFVGLAKWLNLFGFGTLDGVWLQPVRLVSALGAAICVVALIRRFLSGEL